MKTIKLKKVEITVLTADPPYDGEVIGLKFANGRYVLIKTWEHEYAELSIWRRNE